MTTASEIVEEWIQDNKDCKNKFLKWIEEKEITEIREGKEDYWKSWNKHFQEAWGT